MESLYKAQCKTFLIAKKLTGLLGNVSAIDASFNPPFCLRVVKEYRTTAMQGFRDNVAKIARHERVAANNLIN